MANLSVIGGALIGLASSLNYIAYGRITGLSGYLFGALTGSQPELLRKRVSFLIGLITIVDICWKFNEGQVLGSKVLEKEEKFDIIRLAFGAFLVGFGVRFGGGCTSGHGVCGLPRLSLRSFIAVPTFMIFGILTATFGGKYLELLPKYYVDTASVPEMLTYIPRVLLTAYQINAGVYILLDLLGGKTAGEKLSSFFFFVTGGMFGAGLLVSGMCTRGKILAFLTLGSNWDYSLMLVMASAVGVNFVPFQVILRMKKSVFSDRIDMHSNYLDKNILIGPALFGIGWGITGLCPGPALANLTVQPYALPLVLFIFTGQYAYDLYYDFSLKRLQDRAKIN